ncbi:hypothetical protein PFLL34_03936 [Pseudomonas fluorescens]|nr:hypothetical protein PFLL34_03936 [Pseudomonas fluorescens]
MNSNEPVVRVAPELTARWPPSAMVTLPNKVPVPPRVAPLPTATLVLAREPLTSKLPAWTWASPVTTLRPPRVKAPVPSLARLPRPATTPSKVLSRLLLPTLKVLPAATVASPVPVRAPRLALPPRFKDVPLARLTPAPTPSAPLPSVVRLPDCTSNRPLKVLVPIRLTSAVPVLTRLPLPASTPARVRLLLRAPTVSPAFRLTALANTSGVLLASVAAPFTFKAPVPRAAAVPRVSVPALRVVPPWKVLTPLRVRLAVPSLLRPAVPVTRPPRVRSLLPVTARLASSTTPLPTLSAAVLSRVAAPPTVRLPRPRAVALPKVSVPAFRVVPPR